MYVFINIFNRLLFDFFNFNTNFLRFQMKNFLPQKLKHSSLQRRAGVFNKIPRQFYYTTLCIFRFTLLVLNCAPSRNRTYIFTLEGCCSIH